jgi:hypothetical protein
MRENTPVKTKMEKGEKALDILSISKNQRGCMYIENIQALGKPVISY